MLYFRWKTTEAYEDHIAILFLSPSSPKQKSLGVPLCQNSPNLHRQSPQTSLLQFLDEGQLTEPEPGKVNGRCFATVCVGIVAQVVGPNKVSSAGLVCLWPQVCIPNGRDNVTALQDRARRWGFCWDVWEHSLNKCLPLSVIYHTVLLLVMLHPPVPWGQPFPEHSLMTPL